MKTWQIIQRQNKSALTVGSASAAIPEYVAPTLKTFRIYGVYGEERTAVDGEERVLTKGVVYFYFELANPDNLPILNLEIDGESWWSLENPLEHVGEEMNGSIALRREGQGYVYENVVDDGVYYGNNPYTPQLTITYQTPDQTEQQVSMASSNGPLTVIRPSFSVAPSWGYVGTEFVVQSTEDEGLASVYQVSWDDGMVSGPSRTISYRGSRSFTPSYTGRGIRGYAYGDGSGVSVYEQILVPSITLSDSLTYANNFGESYQELPYGYPMSPAVEVPIEVTMRLQASGTITPYVIGFPTLKLTIGQSTNLYYALQFSTTPWYLADDHDSYWTITPYASFYWQVSYGIYARYMVVQCLYDSVDISKEDWMAHGLSFSMDKAVTFRYTGDKLAPTGLKNRKMVAVDYPANSVSNVANMAPVVEEVSFPYDMSINCNASNSIKRRLYQEGDISFSVDYSVVFDSWSYNTL